jgi:hypothetical protein
MSDLETLEALVPQPVELTIAGESIAFMPLRVGQLPVFLRTVDPIIRQMTSPVIDWLAILGTHGEALLAALALATGKPLAWIEQLSADEAIELAAQVVEVNADFFIRTVIPRIEAITGKISVLTEQVNVGNAGNKGGVTPSSS